MNWNVLVGKFSNYLITGSSGEDKPRTIFRLTKEDPLVIHGLMNADLKEKLDSYIEKVSADSSDETSKQIFADLNGYSYSSDMRGYGRWWVVYGDEIEGKVAAKKIYGKYHKDRAILFLETYDRFRD